MSDTAMPGLEYVEIETTINGKRTKARVKARQHLADFLRQELELTGTHLGCEHGACGACTVLIDGRTSRGCLVLAAQVHGKKIDTVEGLSASGALAPLQDAFIRLNAAQCGFCTSGMLLTGYELVSAGGVKTRDDIRDYISGNMCRCTGYHAIVDAIESVLAKQSEHVA
jgi:carbon-monoxide dehydrogenase small subunit